MAIFANSEAKRKFLAGVKLETTGEWEGLPVLGTPSAELAECIGEMIGDTKLTVPILKAYNRRVAEADSIILRPSRTGNALSFYERGAGANGRDKHRFSPTMENVELLLSNAAKVEAFKASEGVWYYQYTPSYKYRQKDQPAKEAAVIVKVAGTLAVKVIAKGDAAAKYAAEHNLTPVNPADDTEGD